MAEIKPFSALIYNQQLVDLSEVIAPPYDLISPAQCDLYYQHSPYNVVRLILGKESPNDDEKNNKYTRAAAYLRRWREEKILIEQEEPAVYVYAFTYRAGGGSKTILGFIAAAALTPFAAGRVLPHEKTFAGPKADRLLLMKAAAANLDQVFSIYNDESGVVHEILTATAVGEPLMTVVDDDGVRHSLWPLSNRRDINRIVAVLADKTLFIADGHHRYETALNYADWRSGGGVSTSLSAYNYIPMLLIDIVWEKPELLPTHRIIKELHGHTPAEFLEKLGVYFNLTKQKDLGGTLTALSATKAANAFGMYLKKAGFYLLELKAAAPPITTMPDSASPAWKSLDTAVFQCLIIGQLLNYGEEKNSPDILTFSDDAAAAAAAVDKGAAAFFLRPTRLDEVKAVAENQEKMPQKSTYFYPKPLTGLIMRLIDSGSRRTQV